MAHLYIVARLRGEVADGCHGGDARSLVAVYSRYPVVHPPVGKNNGVCRHTGVFSRVVVWQQGQRACGCVQKSACSQYVGKMSR